MLVLYLLLFNLHVFVANKTETSMLLPARASDGNADADGAARTLAAHPEWWLRNASGSLMHNLDSGRPANESWLTYDHTVLAAASAWRDACLRLTASGFVDACYVDGCTKSPKGLTAAKSNAYGPAKMKMLVDLQSRVPGPLICGSNGAIWPVRPPSAPMRTPNIPGQSPIAREIWP